jgi:Nucleotidyl transferase AbiEii toxin, Type IV TA system
MKDYFDLWVLLRDSPLDKHTLSQAIAATTQRRGTVKPLGLPIGLSEQFAQDRQKQNQWRAFIKRNQLDAPSLDDVVAFLRKALDFFNLKQDSLPL